jgi:hypothetical protein
MPVKMVALRKHYVSEARKEYNAGESYVVHDKRIAEKLERRLKAKSQPETPADRRFPPAAAPAPAPAAPKVRARALTAETETPAPTPVPTPAPSATPVPPAAPGPAPATLVELPAPDVGRPALTTAAVPDTGETAESKARYARRDLRAEEA